MERKIFKLSDSPDSFPKQWSRSVYIYSPSDLERSLDNLTDCVVFLPNHEAGKPITDDIPNWENSAVELSDLLVFWLPESSSDEDLAKCSSLFGEWVSSGKVIYGREKMLRVEPTDPSQQQAPGEESEAAVVKFGHLDLLAKQQKLTIHTSFAECLEEFNKKTQNREPPRRDGERYVPLHVWNHKAFKTWYENITKEDVGNRIEKARFEWAFQVGPKKSYLLYWVMHMDIYIKAEDRIKSDEIVLGRTDITIIFPYYMPEGEDVDILDCEVVTIKEFRSPATTVDSFIYELPGGSGFKPLNPIQEVANELSEEVGVEVPPEDFHRIVSHGPRQLACLTSVHEGHLFSIELTAKEMEECREKARLRTALGTEAETELTYIQVLRLADALEDNLLDWSMLGMIHSVLHEALLNRQKRTVQAGSLTTTKKKTKKKKSSYCAIA